MGPGGWIAAAAVAVTIVLWLVERRDRKADARAADEQFASEARQREALEGKVAALQSDQNAILSGIGDGIRTAVDPERREALGARISPLSPQSTPSRPSSGEPPRTPRTPPIRPSSAHNPGSWPILGRIRGAPRPAPPQDQEPWSRYLLLEGGVIWRRGNRTEMSWRVPGPRL